MSTSVLKALPGKLDIKRHSPSILHISASLAMSSSVLNALPGKLDIKRHSPSILYIWQASRCQQAFSKPCLVNLISKDTHLVFSISLQASRCQQAKPCLVNLISVDTHLVFSISSARPVLKLERTLRTTTQNMNQTINSHKNWGNNNKPTTTESPP